MKDGITMIIKYMSERFSKSFDDDDDYEEWADNVHIKYVETTDDEDIESKYIMKPVNSDCFLEIEDMVKLEKMARENGYNTSFLIPKILFEREK